MHKIATIGTLLLLWTVLLASWVSETPWPQTPLLNYFDFIGKPHADLTRFLSPVVWQVPALVAWSGLYQHFTDLWTKFHDPVCKLPDDLLPETVFLMRWLFDHDLRICEPSPTNVAFWESAYAHAVAGAIGTVVILFVSVTFVPVYHEPGRPSALLPHWAHFGYQLIANAIRFGAYGNAHQGVAARDNAFRHHARANFRVRQRTFRCAKGEFHGHPRLAACRRGAHLALIQYIQSKGMIPYEVSASRRSEKMTGGVGFHGWFSARDHAYKRRNHSVNPERHIIVGVDVDYYMDIPKLMMHMTPIMLYSFDPHTRSGNIDNEATWTTTGNTVHYDVAGGHCYAHELWDYGADDYVAHTVGPVRHIFAVEKMKPFVESPHAVVILQPVCVVPYWQAADVHELRRREMPSGVSVRGNTTRIVDGDLDVSMPSVFYEDLMARIVGSDYVSVNEINGWILNNPEVLAGMDRTKASRLASYLHREHIGNARPAPVRHYSRDIMIRGLLEGGVGRSPVDDTGVHPLAGATAYVPTRSRATEAAAVQTRLYNIANNKVPDPVIAGFVEEFVERMSTTKLKAATEEETINRASRPSTRFGMIKARMNAFLLGLTVRVKAFFKAESYASHKDPRLISPTDSFHQLAVSRITNRYKDAVLKNMPWYAPGLNPPNIANMVARFFRENPKANETDFSRFDGTISEWISRNVVVAIYRRSFPDDQDLVDHLEREIKETYATTAAGRYFPNGSRLSGSPITTDGNTIINAAVQYIGNRLAGRDPDTAFAKIGIAYGDDGAVDDECRIVDAANRLGLTIKVEPCYVPKRPYATFVGRVFPVQGKEGSFQEPLRALGKFGLVSRVCNVDPMSLLAARAYCYYVSDRNTPILGPLMRKIIDLSPTNITDRLIESVRPYIGRDVPLGNTWPGVDPTHRPTRALVGRLLGAVDNLATIESKIDSLVDISQVSGLIRVTSTGPETHTGYDSSTLFTYFNPLQFGRCAERPTIINNSEPSNEQPETAPAQAAPPEPTPAGPPAANRSGRSPGLAAAKRQPRPPPPPPGF